MNELVKIIPTVNTEYILVFLNIVTKFFLVIISKQNIEVIAFSNEKNSFPMIIVVKTDSSILDLDKIKNKFVTIINDIHILFKDGLTREKENNTIRIIN